MNQHNTVKYRLDQRVHALGLTASRQRARALIMAGKILVNDQPVDKPGAAVSEVDRIRLKGEDLRYVSRGGLKLEAALETFALDVSGWTCLDVGASTGGFTDCLLQHGAGKVYAMDVGYGQLAWQLRQDSRVVVIERTSNTCTSRRVSRVMARPGSKRTSPNVPNASRAKGIFSSARMLSTIKRCHCFGSRGEERKDRTLRIAVNAQRASQIVRYQPGR